MIKLLAGYINQSFSFGCIDSCFDKYLEIESIDEIYNDYLQMVLILNNMKINKLNFVSEYFNPEYLTVDLNINELENFLNKMERKLRNSGLIIFNN